MKYLLIPTGLYILVSITFMLFSGVMHLKHLKDDGKLSKNQIRLAYGGLLIGYLCDFLTNIIMTPLSFLTWPRHWLFSDTLTYYKHAADWRADMSKRWAKLLDSLDPSGSHV